MTKYTENGIDWVEITDKQIREWNGYFRIGSGTPCLAKQVAGRIECSDWCKWTNNEGWRKNPTKPDGWPFETGVAYDQKAWSRKQKRDAEKEADKLRRSRAKRLEAMGVPISVVHNRIKHSEFDALLDAVEALALVPNGKE